MDAADLERRAAAGDAPAQLQLAQRLAGQGRRDDAEKWLRQAASGGHADAMAALGLHLLNRPPPAPPGLIDEARRFLMMAGERGHADAAHLVSLMLAITPSVPRNWTRALDFLGHAAAAGHAGAQAQLQFLSPESVDGDWQAMRQALNLAALLKVPPLRRVCASPLIAVAEGFLDARTCDWIRERARPKLSRAQIYGAQGQASAASSRTNSVMHFPFPEMDLPLFLVLQRAGALLGLPIQGMEPTSVLHYRPGEEFKPHYDFLDPRNPAFAAEIGKAGQRIATFLVYLNDDFEGGETDFSKANVRFKGKKGDAILFHNVDARGSPDFNTLHAGLAPTSGEKWLLSQWIRGVKPPPPAS